EARRHTPERTRAAMRRGRGTYASGQFAHLRVSLTPQRVDIGVLSGDRDRRIGGAAEVDRNMRRPYRLHGRESALKSVVAAVVIEWLVARPHLAHDLEILVGARIAFVLGEEIAVLALLGVVAA